MLLAFGRNGAKDTDLVVRDYTFEDLAQRFAVPKTGSKDGSYMIRGGALREPKRADENLLKAELLVIDGDSRFDPETGEILTGAPPIETAIAALDALRYRYIIHTSHSFVPGEIWKYRIYIPANIPDTMALTAAVSMVIEQMQGAGCPINDVKENHCWSQAWYLPRCKPEYVASYICRASISGRDVDVGSAVAAQNARLAGEAAVRRAQEAPATPRTDTGESIIKEFNRAADLGYVRGMLEAHGYRFAFRKGDTFRYIAPSSETKTPGVTVFKGKEGDWCVYSHHGAHDPLSHTFADPFRLFAVFEHGGDLKAAAKALRKPETALEWSEAAALPENFKQPVAASSGPLFHRAKEFSAAWKPAEYLVDGIIQRGYCYSLTSPTGGGKTAVILNLTASVGSGRSFAGIETLPGRVGYFAAENPNDIQARWKGLEEVMGFDDPEVYFCPDTIDLSVSFDRIAAEAEAAGGFDLIIVDTSQAFFKGQDENSNAQMVEHAKAMRKLTTLPGNPCVVILTHPVKNPSKDNLLPRGGGGFLAEVDGNLTIWNDAGNLMFHHQGKFRGAGFAPINFALKPVNPTCLKDAKGRQIPTVIAEFLTEEQYNVRLLDNATDQDRVMILILNGKGKLTVAEMARIAGWTSNGGVQNKAKVHRILMQLREEKLVSKRRNGRWALTAAGLKEIGPKAKALGIEAAEEMEPENDEYF